MQELVGRHDAARDVVIVGMMAAHEVKIGRRQDGERHAGIGEPLRRRLEGRHRQARRLGDMADRDTAAILIFLRALADMLEVHAVGGRAEIEMQVDVDVEFARDFEDAVDLAGRIAVDIGRTADGAAAAIERFHHQLIGAGIVEQSLLRKHANLQIDRPGIFLDQRQDAFEAAQADARIDLQMRAHMSGALQDRLFQRAGGARVHVLGREGSLGLGGLARSPPRDRPSPTCTRSRMQDLSRWM